ncbi:MAG: dicarboxylate/amino acid:cation symporter [Deltaproteobacteria bacterium]|nr:dicarboxylate/amino acid:cation symporter [Deltaproteobacteria bacterium]
MPLPTRILLGLLVGAALGAAANVGFGPKSDAVVFLNTWIAGPVGQVFLRLMFMVVMPLVFASIVLGVAGIGDLRRVGRLGGKTLAYFLASTTVAGGLGLVLALVVAPGAALHEAVRAELMATYATDASGKVAAAKAGGVGIETFVAIVTRNPIKSAVDGDMLGVIFFALAFGAALTLIDKERARALVDVLGGINDVMVKLVELAMRLAPVGVAMLIFGVTSRFGFALLRPLGLFAALVLGGLLLHATLLVLVVVRGLVGLSPALFLARVKTALVTAFSTSSSSATLPTNIAVAEDQLGVPAKIAGFVLPLGATMCMNGTALFEGVTVLFLCQVFGVDLSVAQMALVVALTVITAVGAAGVPGGSIPLLVGVLAMFGVPGEGIAIVLGVDRILDMARTTVNVLGDLTCVTLVAKSEGAWDPQHLPTLHAKPLDASPGWPAPDDVAPRGP